MSVQFNVNLFCKSGVTKAQAIDALTKELKRKSPATVRTTIMPFVGKFWSVALVDGEGKAKGSKVLDKTAPKYENAKRDLYDLVKAITGTQSSGKKEPVAVPKKLVSNLASEIIEAGLTKAQFNELLAQLRDAVSFQ